METITILPKDVTVTWFPEEKLIEIKINKETMIEKETGNLLLEMLYDELGDLITCNEINPTTDTWLVEDSEIYILTPKNIAELKETGSTKIGFRGLIKDNVDLDVDSDIDFIMWYYHADTIEEAVQLMNEN
jgi:hypothetical protein